MAGVIPHAEAQERVDGTEDRLIGVVDALKYLSLIHISEPTRRS